MNQNIDTQKLPEVVSFIPRILAALRDMNGVAKAGAVKSAVVQAMAEAGEPMNDQMLASGVPKYQNDIYWARMYLVNAGLLEPAKTAGHGTWKLTAQGWESPLDMTTAAAIYFQTATKTSLNKDQTDTPAPAGTICSKTLRALSTGRSNSRRSCGLSRTRVSSTYAPQS